MRGLRVLSVCALALTSLSAVPAAHAAGPPTAPYTVLALNGPADDRNLARDDVFSGSALNVGTGMPDEQIILTGHLPLGIDQADATVYIRPNSTSLADGTFPVSDSGAASTVGILISTDRPSGNCTATGGSLKIKDFTTDPVAGDITGFAASFSVHCGAGVFTGLVRDNSSESFDAVSISPRDWSFGNQLAHHTGPSRALRFTNEGTDAVTFRAAKLAGDTPGDFRIRHDGCKTHTVAPGESCTVSVAPHPHLDGADIPTYATLELPTTGAVRTRIVQLEVWGDSAPEVQAVPGADRIRLAWGQLPGRFNAYVDRDRIYRGTSPKNLAPLRRTPYGARSLTDRHVVPGRTYYYQVVPLGGTHSGEPTPVVAAIAWPRYSAGMYHRVTPVHLLHQHIVRAGHPYSFRVLGHHGIPKSGVSALALDVVADHPSSPTQVTVYPAGAHRPKAADVTAPAGHSASNFAITAVGKHGKVTVSTTQGSTPVTLDVSGYYSAANLSHHFGPGAAEHIFTGQGLLADTKRYQKAPLPHGYYLRTPINFSPGVVDHVTSAIVQVTAYGSKADGTINAYATGKHIPGTTALAYRAGATTTNTAIVPVAPDAQSRNLPSVSFYNRGPRPVQLIVTIMGFYDDNTLTYGQRYSPTRPIQLTSRRLGSGSPANVRPGSHANFWTSSLNLKVAAAGPSASTTLALGPGGFKHPFPAHPLMHLSAGESLVASTSQPVGKGNTILLRNAHGHVAVSVWSFGRFQAWPAPRHTPSYAGMGSTRTSARLAPAQ